MVSQDQQVAVAQAVLAGLRLARKSRAQNIEPLTDEEQSEFAARVRLLDEALGPTELSKILRGWLDPSAFDLTPRQLHKLADRVIRRRETGAQKQRRRLLSIDPQRDPIKAVRAVQRLIRLRLIEDAQKLCLQLPEETNADLDMSLMRAAGDLRTYWEMRRDQKKTSIQPQLLFLKVSPELPHLADPMAVPERVFYRHLRVLILSDQFDEAVALAFAGRDRVAASGDLGKLLVPALEHILSDSSETLKMIRGEAGRGVRMRDIYALPDRKDRDAAFCEVARRVVNPRDALDLARVWCPVPNTNAKTSPTLEALERLILALGDGDPVFADRVRQSGYALREKRFSLAWDGMDLAGVPKKGTDRRLVRDLFSEPAGETRGTLLVSSHHGVVPPASNLPALLAAEGGRTVLSLERGTFEEVSDGVLAEFLNGGSLRSIGRSHTSDGEQAAEFLTVLRTGGVLHVSPDVLFTRSKLQAYVPWFTRSYYLPTFFAYCALITQARIAYALAFATPENDLKVDYEPVSPPTEQGNIDVRAIWTTQRIARAARRFHRRTSAPLSPKILSHQGGVPGNWQRRRKDSHAEPTLSNWLFEEPSGALALRTVEREIGRAELAGAARRFASLLIEARDLAPRHIRSDRRFSDQLRVFGLLSKGETLLSLTLGAHATETLFAPCLPDVDPSELAKRVTDFSPHLVIAEASAWSAACEVDPKLASCPVLICEDGAGLRAQEELTEGYAEATAPPAPREHQPGFVFYTSGSTGAPKGIVVPSGILSGAGGLDRLEGLGRSDRVCYLTRWDAVGLADILACLRGGASLHLPLDTAIADPAHLRDWLDASKLTVLSAPVTLWKHLSHMIRSGQLRDDPCRIGFLWGERVSPSVFEAVSRALPKVRFSVNLGATESSYIGYGHLTAGRFHTLRGGPGGLVLPDRVVDLSLGSDGEEERLAVRSPSTMLGTMQDMLATDALVRAEDWPAIVRGLDPVRILDDGWIDVLGRPGDFAKIAGRRVGFAAAEDIVNACPGVGRSHVLELEAEDGQTALAVAVETDRDDHAALRAEISDRLAAALFPQARPRAVVVFDRFPMLPSGKLDRSELRARLTDEAGMSSDGTRPVEAVPSSAAAETAKGRILDWARSRGFFAAGFEGTRHLAEFSSIQTMELHLLAEEYVGAHVLGALNLQDLSTWSDLAEEFERLKKSHVVG